MNPTILLLISDRLVLSVVKETLERAGMFVSAAGDLGVAVDRMAEIPSDLLIAGAYTTEISGREAATYLRNKQPGLKILILGGFLDDDRLRNRDELGGFDVFPPRITAAQLVEKVKAMLKLAGK